MALKLDDLLVKKKEPVQILDLSKSTANSKEELKKLLEKIPEYKIKMEKVRPEDIKIQNKNFTFKTPKKELKSKPFPFANPIPVEMRSLNLNDLCSVGIQWKMLTSLRPKSKLDEEYFSRLVELGKLQITTREKEKKTPLESFVRKSKNRAGVTVSKVISCRDCGEEFCKGETCRVFAYDSYERTNVPIIAVDVQSDDAKKKKTGGVKKKGSTKKQIKRIKKVVKKKRKPVKRAEPKPITPFVVKTEKDKTSKKSASLPVRQVRQQPTTKPTGKPKGTKPKSEDKPAQAPKKSVEKTKNKKSSKKGHVKKNDSNKNK